MRTLSIQVLVSNTIFQLKESELLAKTPESRTRTGNKYKMSLQHHIMLEKKRMCSKKQNNGSISRGHERQLKQFPMPKAGTI